ncbi:DICT sensory domain-containing protein [Natronorubrum texcoconense]|uniref:Diguanylate Cyclase and Two-component system sensory domain-containing protein n=1 Tax=Natronorubrum texcoconense TaxID=1095776 RepID=A0A1G8XKT9_9EURY|nr:DICT sensory domain-containing protein [Natronorubrum texcoconense]SDJ90380.1 Diguanylate Cyclase and Two-component system sensory domain-containing protein [Natronorubrum texcoconense]
MSLSAYVDRYTRPNRSIVVYAPPPRPAVVDRLEAEIGVEDVEHRTLPSVTAASQAFLVVREDAEFVAAVGLDAVREFLEPPVYDPWDERVDETTYRRVIDIFESTVWHDLDRRRLLAVSREIENRAWRVGSGTLRVGFQRADALEKMVPVYNRLAAESALEIHVYIDDEWDQPSIPGVTIHPDSGDEIGSCWFLVFDGDGDELWNSALLATETDPGVFDGFWVDDTRQVAALERAVLESAE